MAAVVAPELAVVAVPAVAPAALTAAVLSPSVAAAAGEAQGEQGRDQHGGQRGGTGDAGKHEGPLGYDGRQPVKHLRSDNASLWASARVVAHLIAPWNRRPCSRGLPRASSPRNVDVALQTRRASRGATSTFRQGGGVAARRGGGAAAGSGLVTAQAAAVASRSTPKTANAAAAPYRIVFSGSRRPSAAPTDDRQRVGGHHAERAADPGAEPVRRGWPA